MMQAKTDICRKLVDRFYPSLTRMNSDSRGAGAIEFALLAPILVVLYMGAVETTVALSVDNKVSRAGNLTLDLITQGTIISDAELDTMVDMAASVLAPYSADNVDLKFTGIQINAAGQAKVTWSWGNNVRRPYAFGSIISIPANLNIANAFYVRGEIANRHNFITTYPFTGSKVASLNLNETYYMRPRLGAAISCSDC